MTPQYVAAGLVSENKVLAHPAMHEDRSLAGEIESVAAAVRSGDALAAVEAELGALA